MVDYRWGNGAWRDQPRAKCYATWLCYVMPNRKLWLWPMFNFNKTPEKKLHVHEVPFKFPRIFKFFTDVKFGWQKPLVLQSYYISTQASRSKLTGFTIIRWLISQPEIRFTILKSCLLVTLLYKCKLIGIENKAHEWKLRENATI